MKTLARRRKLVLFVIVILVPFLLTTGLSALIINRDTEEISTGYFSSGFIKFNDAENDALYPQIIEGRLLGIFSENATEDIIETIKQDVFILSSFDSVTGEYIDGFFITKGFTKISKRELENLQGNVFKLERVRTKK